MMSRLHFPLLLNLLLLLHPVVSGAESDAENFGNLPSFLQSSKLENPLKNIIIEDLASKTSFNFSKSYKILVEPKGLVSSDGKLVLPNQLSAQARNKIVIKSRSSSNFEIIKLFKSIDMLVMIANLEGLTELIESDSVAYIGLDVGGRGGLLQALPQIGIDSIKTQYGITGKNIHVAVLDTGIDTDHIDLEDSVQSQKCFADFCPDGADIAEDDNGHGTHVSGIIAGSGLSGPVGSAPDARMHAIKVLDNTNSFSSTSIITEALDYIINELPEVDLVNMSLGTNQRFESYCDNDYIWLRGLTTAIDILRDRGTLSFVASMNNASSNSIGAPACISGAIAMGAVWDTDPYPYNGGCVEPNPIADQMTCFSNSSIALDILAPGSPIRSARMNGGSVNYSGTSMATPLGVGCAALLMERSNNLSPNQIESLLKDSTEVFRADPVGREYPRIDCLASLIAIPNSSTPMTNIDIDGNNSFDALTDGLLILRSMFGLTGAALTSGATADDAMFVSSGDLAQRYDSALYLLDIDDNGQLDALTDGLLILRFLFGLRGEELVSQATANDSARSTPQEIEDYLATLIQ